MDDEMLLEPPDERTAAVRDAVFHDVIAAHNAEKYYNRERSRAGWWVGGIGAAIGVLGMTAGVVIAVYHQPQIRYTEVDDASGVVRESYGAADAPAHFGEQVIRHYLWEYITLRERFVWAMDPETDRRVKLMSAPAEQVRYAAEREKEAPGSKYGINGYARVVRFAALTLRGKGKDKTLEYDVQFVKGEVTASNPNAAMETHMTARIIFAFHPELPMSAADRLDNEPGLMVISYVSTSDGR